MRRVGPARRGALGEAQVGLGQRAATCDRSESRPSTLMTVGMPAPRVIRHSGLLPAMKNSATSGFSRRARVQRATGTCARTCRGTCCAASAGGPAARPSTPSAGGRRRAGGSRRRPRGRAPSAGSAAARRRSRSRSRTAGIPRVPRIATFIPDLLSGQRIGLDVGCAPIAPSVNSAARLAAALARSARSAGSRREPRRARAPGPRGRAGRRTARRRRRSRRRRGCARRSPACRRASPRAASGRSPRAALGCTSGGAPGVELRPGARRPGSPVDAGEDERQRGAAGALARSGAWAARSAARFLRGSSSPT